MLFLSLIHIWIIVEAYNKGLLEEYELTGILGRTKEKTEALAEKGGCRPCKMCIRDRIWR